jgi:uncharacterized membrane protein
MNSSESKRFPDVQKSSESVSPSGWNDHNIELVIGHLLRAGVVLSASVICIGGLIYLIRHGGETADYRTFRGGLSTLRSIPGIISGTLHLTGRGIIQLGLLLLIATPIARVIFSAIAFAREHDYLYVAFTLIVLAVLAYSLLEANLH